MCLPYVYRLLTIKTHLWHNRPMDSETIKEITIDPGKLVEARTAKGLTQSDVARELGFDRRQIWQFEKGTGLEMKPRLFLNFLLNAVTFLILGAALTVPILYDNDEILANTEAFWRAIFK
jgi:transcriptional regulator with XRE-family HTH domain